MLAAASAAAKTNAESAAPPGAAREAAASAAAKTKDKGAADPRAAHEVAEAATPTGEASAPTPTVEASDPTPSASLPVPDEGTQRYNGTDFREADFAQYIELI